MGKSLEESLQALSSEQKIQLVVSQEQTLDDEISLAELMQKIIRGKRLIILCTIIAFLISSLGFGAYTTLFDDKQGVVSTVISLNFEGIEEGLNPLGEAFSISEMTNKQVLESTIAELNLMNKGIDAEMLRKNLEIQSIVPQDVLAQIMTINKMAEKDVSQLEKIEQLEYYPTQYKVQLHILKDMNLTGQEAEQVLVTLIDNYKDYFMEKYNDKQLISNAITTVDPSRYDYAEYILLVDEQVETAKSFLENKLKEATDFRSKITGLSFEDLIAQLNLVKSIDINNIQALVNSKVLTKDKERLISIYQNKIMSMTFEQEKYAQLATSLYDAAYTYQKDKMVVMGKEGAAGNIEVAQNSAAYDDLIRQAVEAEEQANKLYYEIMYYKDLLAKLSPETGEIIQDDVKAYTQKIEQDIQALSEKVNMLIQMINTTLEDYYTTEVFKDSVRSDMPALYQSSTMAVLKQGMLILVIGSVLGGIIGVMLALLKGTFKVEEEVNYEI